MSASLQSGAPIPREGFVPVKNAELFIREPGQGQPIIVIHGGPDFDHTHLLPDMDRLSDSYRLIYYDQRGRGRSRGKLRLEDISIEQTIDDLEALQEQLGLETVAILGHSWGGHVAMHYAIRRPDRVSHMVLMNKAPASYEDFQLVQSEAMPAARLIALSDCGHFAYIESPEEVHQALDDFFSSHAASQWKICEHS